MAYTVGDLALLTAKFTNAQTGALADPTTVVFTVRDPTGIITTPTATRVSMGVYTWVQDLEIVGNWEWKAVGSGALQVASDPSQGSFSVVDQLFY